METGHGTADVQQKQHFKGAALKGIIEYIRSRWGEEGLQKVIDNMSPDAREWGVRRIMDNEWVPDAHSNEFLVTMDKLFGRGDMALVRKAWKDIAAQNLSGVYRVFAKMSSVESIMKRSDVLWKTYYDTGKIHIIKKGKGHMEAEVVGYVPYESSCPGLLGWIDYIFEFYKVKGQVTHPMCKLRGDPQCIYDIKWE